MGAGLSLARLLSPRPQGPPHESPQFLGWLDLVKRYIDQTGTRIIQHQDAATDASIDFTAGITAEFPAYMLVVSDYVPATDNTEFWIRVSEDSGATWEDDASDYRYGRMTANDAGTVAGAGSAADTEIAVVVSVGNASGESLSGVFFFTTPSSSTLFKKIFGVGCYTNNAGNILAFSIGAQYDGSANAINGIQVLSSSGDITSGGFTLYGLRKMP